MNDALHKIIAVECLTLASTNSLHICAKLEIIQIEIQIFYVCLQAYYREGLALQALGKDADALASLASGLAQDPKSPQLLSGFTEAVRNSFLKGTF